MSAHSSAIAGWLLPWPPGDIRHQPLLVVREREDLRDRFCITGISTWLAVDASAEGVRGALARVGNWPAIHGHAAAFWASMAGNIAAAFRPESVPL